MSSIFLKIFGTRKNCKKYNMKYDKEIYNTICGDTHGREEMDEKNFEKRC